MSKYYTRRSMSKHIPGNKSTAGVWRGDHIFGEKKKIPGSRSV